MLCLSLHQEAVKSWQKQESLVHSTIGWRAIIVPPKDEGGKARRSKAQKCYPYQIDGEAVPEQRGQKAYDEELRAAQDHGRSALP